MKKISTCFLDLDGVIVNWLDAIRQHIGAPPEIYDGFRKDPLSLNHDTVDALYGGRPAFKAIQQSRPPEWWLNLEMYPWANNLINRLNNNFPLVFLTSPGTCPMSGQGKLQWQAKNYPDIPIVIARHKWVVASSTKVLIDDDDWQLSRFSNAGGHSIKWRNQFELAEFTPKAIEYYIDCIVDKVDRYDRS